MDYTAIKNCLKSKLEDAKFVHDEQQVSKLERLLQKVEDNESDYGWLDYID